MTDDPARRIPVVIAAGEVNDRPLIETEGLEPLQLMLAALREAERHLGRAILDRIDWLGVEDQISFPDPRIHERLAELLPRRPASLYRTPEASGDGPIRMIADAANMIGREEIGVAAIVGAEAMRTAAKRAQADAAAARERGDVPTRGDTLAQSSEDYAPALGRKFGITVPTDVYPLYEQATRAAWGQSFAQAQEESANIWAGNSRVAAANPAAWLRKPVAAEDIARISPDNRIVSYPYTKLMVANSAVNQGAAVIVASLAVARDLGLDETQLVYVGAGAAATEPFDYFARDSFSRVASLETTIAATLEFNGVRAADLDHVELYSCFPCIPKMARRALDWSLDRPASVYGGLTFGGGPIGNCMTHAVAAMVRALGVKGTNGLIVANGGYATHSHAMLFTRIPPADGMFPQVYDVQSRADATRGLVPALVDGYIGPGTVETFSVPFDRAGAPRFAVVVARTPAGDRFLTRVPGSDTITLARLMSPEREAVGALGVAFGEADGTVWRFEE